MCKQRVLYASLLQVVSECTMMTFACRQKNLGKIVLRLWDERVESRLLRINSDGKLFFSVFVFSGCCLLCLRYKGDCGSPLLSLSLSFLLSSLVSFSVLYFPSGMRGQRWRPSDRMSFRFFFFSSITGAVFASRFLFSLAILTHTYVHTHYVLRLTVSPLPSLRAAGLTFKLGSSPL